MLIVRLGHCVIHAQNRRLCVKTQVALKSLSTVLRLSLPVRSRRFLARMKIALAQINTAVGDLRGNSTTEIVKEAGYSEKLVRDIVRKINLNE